ncbi:hypothetical protein EV143_1234 [Flavobacterium chryseum]|nr:hypothetical protein EV143_1234 [Flavobacterium sp. P3160]
MNIFGIYHSADDNSKYKRNINRISQFGLILLVFSLVYTILERGLLGDLNFYPSSGNLYIFCRNVIAISLTKPFEVTHKIVLT